ncbi:hypothetical protein SAMN06264364_13227 [Quadrisphaera granulorum]|uniref:YacP-like NYN domain-containing protein n=1 Tax=Quadrisphaera granulorum TaxID=317664 RepID=A0A315ZS77_9ACTN|nr:hypothetical protein [Quadrisphaera granulorum]PWJ48149.1 hypothetical protein BXY45_13227 [Quadrisphaera granulorum]SZE98518.1 hypothetical protein SAMN06264364_13227 [Quadrisphaera granulorum]
MPDDDGRRGGAAPDDHGDRAGPHRAHDGEERVELVVDAANVVGSRPDGWWRDRAGAAARLLAHLSVLAALGRATDLAGGSMPLGTVHAVLEGAARAAARRADVQGVEVHLAPSDGDSAIVALVEQLVQDGRRVVVVTADRGLRARLPPGTTCMGPGWLRTLLDELQADRPG